MKLSIVIPVYNGAKTIAPLVDDVRATLKDYDLEIVLVNDGSRDESEAICEGLARDKSNVKFISLRRNFGEHNAVMCGLNHVTGDYVAVIDDDFQNPPSEIVKLVNEALKGYDVVYSKYHHKQHNWFRNFGSKFNDWMATQLMDKPKDLYLSSFRVMSRDIVQEIIRYRGPFPYIDGLILRATNNISSVYVEHAARSEGRSNYTFGRLLSVHLNMISNFSIKPLRILMALGLVTFTAGFLFAAYLVYMRVTNQEQFPGWTSLMVAVIILSGVQLMFLGLIGEYLGKQYLDQNNTPAWVVKKVVTKAGNETAGGSPNIVRSGAKPEDESSDRLPRVESA